MAVTATVWFTFGDVEGDWEVMMTSFDEWFDGGCVVWCTVEYDMNSCEENDFAKDG